jgi:hypothetical protein
VHSKAKAKAKAKASIDVDERKDQMVTLKLIFFSQHFRFELSKCGK